MYGAISLEDFIKQWWENHLELAKTELAKNGQFDELPYVEYYEHYLNITPNTTVIKTTINHHHSDGLSRCLASNDKDAQVKCNDYVPTKNKRCGHYNKYNDTCDYTVVNHKNMLSFGG